MAFSKKSGFLLLTFLLCVIVKEISTEKASGINKVFEKAINKIFKSDADKVDKPMSTFKKVTTWMSVGANLAKAVYFLVKLIKTFTGDNESKELKFLKKQFNIVNTKMDSLDYEFSEIKDLIDWRTLQVNFGKYERQIMALDMKMKNYVKAPLPIRKIFQDIFVRSYMAHYGDAASKIFNGLIEKGQIFTENLFAIARRYYQNDRVKVTAFGAYMCRVVQRGLNIEASFKELSGEGDEIDDFVKGWEKKFEKLKAFVSKIDADIVKSWPQQYKVDADKFIVRNPNLEPQQMSAAVYALLAAKFPWRAWIIVVFPHRKVEDKVWKLEMCGGQFFVKENVGGKNIYIHSADAGITLKDRPLTRLPSTIKGYYPQMYTSAMEVYNRIPSKSCNSHLMRAVFDQKVKANVMGPEDHVSVKQVKLEISVRRSNQRYPPRPTVTNYMTALLQ